MSGFGRKTTLIAKKMGVSRRLHQVAGWSHRHGSAAFRLQKREQSADLCWRRRVLPCFCSLKAALLCRGGISKMRLKKMCRSVTAERQPPTRRSGSPRPNGYWGVAMLLALLMRQS